MVYFKIRVQHAIEDFKSWTTNSNIVAHDIDKEVNVRKPKVRIRKISPTNSKYSEIFMNEHFIYSSILVINFPHVKNHIAGSSYSLDQDPDPAGQKSPVLHHGRKLYNTDRPKYTTSS